MTREYITNPNGHVWKLDEDGEVDIFALDEGFHNGPQCVLCGYSFCHHCNTRFVPKCKAHKAEKSK